MPDLGCGPSPKAGESAYAIRLSKNLMALHGLSHYVWISIDPSHNNPMKTVGILGSGAVAKALAQGFQKEGYAVILGSRAPAKKLGEFAAGTDFRLGTFAEAASSGDLLVLAVKGTAAEEALQLAGDSIQGKIIIDATNPIADAPPQGGVLQFFTGPNDSLMERLQSRFPGVRFVKAFNSVGNSLMYRPHMSDGAAPTMFYCGDDEAARQEVADILTRFGWEPCDMGGASAARAIEPLCMLWCIPGFLRNEWSQAFRLVKA